MATAHQVQAALQSQVQAALAGVTVVNKVAIGWPPIKTLTNIAKTQAALVSIYDAKGSKSSTRWGSTVLSQITIPTGIGVVVSGTVLAPNSTLTVTISGSVTTGDALGLVLDNFSSPLVNDVAECIGGTVVQCLSTDTPITIASKLATQLSNDPTLSTWVSAVAIGSTVNITNLLSVPIPIQANVGNGGSQVVEVGRRLRNLQVVVWTGTELNRQIIGDPLDALFAGLEYNFNLQMADGSFGQFYYNNDMYLEDASIQDLYRRDFHVSVDYGVTTNDQLYSVLVPILQYTNT